MNTTKRQRDPLGRSPALYPYGLLALCSAIVITGSVWPIHARSIRADFDTDHRRDRRTSSHVRRPSFFAIPGRCPISARSARRRCWTAYVVSSPNVTLLGLATNLGKGESEAIAIAHERGTLLILDDRLARRHAGLIGVEVTGTLGVLLRAKRDGHIPRVSPLLSRLTELGFHLSSQTRQAVLNLAGES